MEWGRPQHYFIQNFEIVWGAIIPPPGSCMPRPSANLPLYSIIFRYPFVNRPFLGKWGGVNFVKIRKSIFRKTISNPPPHNCAYYFSGGSTPTRWITLRRLPLVRALRNGMEWGRSQTYFIQNIEIVWGAIVPPPSLRVMYAPTLFESPLYSIIFCYPFGNRPFLG